MNETSPKSNPDQMDKESLREAVASGDEAALAEDNRRLDVRESRGDKRYAVISQSKEKAITDAIAVRDQDPVKAQEVTEKGKKRMHAAAKLGTTAVDLAGGLRFGSGKTDNLTVRGDGGFRTVTSAVEQTPKTASTSEVDSGYSDPEGTTGTRMTLVRNNGDRPITKRRVDSDGLTHVTRSVRDGSGNYKDVYKTVLGSPDVADIVTTQIAGDISSAADRELAPVMQNLDQLREQAGQ